ncbi:sulfur carrier protein ThiS [bacterium]|nr:sulfur carrier protein ThiS [bacterium]
MVVLTVNGRLQEFPGDDLTISSVVASIGIVSKGLIAEVNGQLFRADDFNSTRVSTGDRVELIQFMGGGG